MKTIYIKENTNDNELIVNKKLPSIIKSIGIKIIKMFNIIIKIKSETDITYIIPNINNKNLSKKLKNSLEKENKNLRIVYSNEIKKYVNFETKQKVLNGKQMLYYMIEQILNYIINIDNKEEKLQLYDIYILLNEHNFEALSLIEYLIDKVKTINIITNKVNKYKNIEERLYDKGYILSVSNNKKKALKRAKIILNIDFSKEELMKFNINRNAIIINYTDEKIEKLLGFEGIIINRVQINIEDKLKEEFKNKKILYGFNQDELYESTLGFDKLCNQINKVKVDKIKIESLIGNNGKINEKEIILNKKLLTNVKN